MSGHQAVAGRGRSAVLGEFVPTGVTWEAAVVVGAALLSIAGTMVRIPLPFSPVPVTGGTLAVLLTGAALGPLRAGAAQLLFLVLILPLPVSGTTTGMELVTGASGGYLLAFPLASVVVGELARRGWDRSPGSMAAAFLLGSVVIYAFGLPWLAVVGGFGPGETVARGLVPFIPGDTLKAVIAAAALPGVWRLVGRRPGD